MLTLRYPLITGTITPTRAYADNGIYTVTLTDDDGGSDAITFQLIVAPSGYKIFMPTIVKK